MSTSECDKYWHLQPSRPPPQHCGQLLAEPHRNSRNRVHSSHAQYTPNTPAPYTGAGTRT